MERTTLDIKVNVREAQGDCYIVELSGEIDVYTSPKVKDAIGDLIDRGVYNLVFGTSTRPGSAF
jgi:anti-anti-sigma regulatory factor